MLHNKEFLSTKRINVKKDRCYYVPFSVKDKPKTIYGIIDRQSSSLFTSLDGKWKVEQYKNINEVDLSKEPKGTIKVPSCLQLHGYDQIQYVDSHYPFPYDPPYTPVDTPCWHYRKEFNLKKEKGKEYDINFEGVCGGGFYLYVNGNYVGYSQISHCTSEFDITKYLVNGNNVIDVVLLKWSASSYLEDQDMFRWNGIYRNVYLLIRPKKHIEDYFIKTTFDGEDGVFSIKNERGADFTAKLDGQEVFVKKGETAKIIVKNVKPWNNETPNLYDLTLTTNGEVIYEKVGFRTSLIVDGIYKVNGKHEKIKGINRHETHPDTGATITLETIYEDLKLVKLINANAIRTAHYPNKPEFYQLCDVLGIYVMDEADFEAHGAIRVHAGYTEKLWKDFGELMLFSDAICDRQRAMVERDKNRPSVMLWSLGNESGFGKAFYKAVNYVRNRDTRPVHYQGITNMFPHVKKFKSYKGIDMVCGMYATAEQIKGDLFFGNKKETRPFLQCEMAHAMGNGCGDISDYWELYDTSDRLMGGFVWQLCDAVVKKNGKYYYGGDFGEKRHDGNFCASGIFSSDRKPYSSMYEVQAVYGGKRRKDYPAPKFEVKEYGKEIDVKVNETNGQIDEINIDGKNILVSPIRVNVLRAHTDDDRYGDLHRRWKAYGVEDGKQFIYKCTKKDNIYEFEGSFSSDAVKPCLYFTLKYEILKTAIKISIKYKVNDFAIFKLNGVEMNLPRVGLEFAVDEKYSKFNYVGYGPHESYTDKRTACTNDYFSSDAKSNFIHYVRPQETGSHYGSSMLNIENLFTATADKPFSFSVLPYTSKEINKAEHDFELKESGITNICLDVAMRGIGSGACGPALAPRFEIPREDENTFTLNF